MIKTKSKSGQSDAYYQGSLRPSVNKTLVILLSLSSSSPYPSPAGVVRMLRVIKLLCREESFNSRVVRCVVEEGLLVAGNGSESKGARVKGPPSSKGESVNPC